MRLMLPRLMLPRLMPLMLPLLAVLPGRAMADPVAVRAEAQSLSVTCAGADAEIDGSRNSVTFTGACRSLTVRGDGNHVAIQFAPGARIDVEGGGNFIRYSVAGGGRGPGVRVSGSGTDIAATGATAPAAGETLTLTGDNERLDLDCTGRDVEIQGNHSRYVLHGGCHALRALGEDNTLLVTLQPQAKADVEGNGTTLTYSVTGTGAGQPDIVVRGTNARAVLAGAIAEPAPSPHPAAPAPSHPAAPAPSQPATPAPAAATPPAPIPPVAQRPAPAPAMTGPLPTVPVLMHDLQGKVEEPGTLVSFRGEQLFDGGGSLRDDAAPRLAMLAALIDQIHPSGVRITVTDPADADLGRQRASVLQQWLRQSGQVKVAIKPVGTRGDTPTVDVMILR